MKRKEPDMSLEEMKDALHSPDGSPRHAPRATRVSIDMLPFQRPARANVSHDLSFQIIDSFAKDEEIEERLLDTTPTLMTDEKTPFMEHVIHIFGVTGQGESVHVEVQGYQPTFYIAIPCNSEGKPLVQPSEMAKYIRDHLKKKSPGVELKVVRKKPFFGFNDGAENMYLEVTCINNNVRNRVRELFVDPEFKSVDTPFGRMRTLEARLPAYLRFFHERNIRPAGWMTIAAGEYELRDRHNSTCSSHVLVHATKCNPLETTDVAPMITASWDIECVSEDGSFPVATRPTDAVIQISYILRYLNFQHPVPAFRVIFTLGSCHPIDNTVVLSFEQERDLLLAFQQCIVLTDPDLIVGYNIFGFDFNYVYERAKLFGVESRFTRMSRIADASFDLKVQRSSSSAFGDSDFKLIPTPGRVPIDMYVVIKRDENLANYKLDSVAHHFLKLNKLDVSPGDIRRLQQGSAADRKRIAEYCLVDSELPLQLMAKLEVVVKKLGMAQVHKALKGPARPLINPWLFFDVAQEMTLNLNMNLNLCFFDFFLCTGVLGAVVLHLYEGSRYQDLLVGDRILSAAQYRCGRLVAGTSSRIRGCDCAEADDGRVFRADRSE